MTIRSSLGEYACSALTLLALLSCGDTVLGEAYADLRITKDVNLYVGRKEYDTPFINGDDTRMTPNTFEAIVLQGKASFGANEGKTSPSAGEGKASLDAKEVNASPGTN